MNIKARFTLGSSLGSLAHFLRKYVGERSIGCDRLVWYGLLSKRIAGQY